MDFLRRIGRFIGGAAQGVGRAFQQAPQVISRSVLDAERARQQAIAQVQRNLPRFQAPPPPRIQLPQIQIPRVQLPQVRLPQAPRVDLGAVSRALQAPSQAVQQTTRNVLGQAGRTLGDLQRQSDAIRQRQIQQTQADIARFRTSPATAIFQTQALSPFGGISQAFKGAKVGTGRELPKFDTTKAVEDVSKQLAKTPLRKIPGMGVVGDVVKPLALSAARMADVAQTQEEYAQGIKGLGQMGSDIANIGSLFYAGGLSKQLATKGTAFLPTAARLAPRLAASGAGQNILLQLSEGKKLNELDPKQIAAAAAVYTGLGIGIPGVGRAVGKGVRGIKARLPEVEFVRTPRPGQVAPTPAVRPQRIAQEVPTSAMQPRPPRIDVTSPEAQSLKPTSVAINKLKSIAGDRQLAMEDYRAGRFSMTDLPVLVKREKNGTLTVLDGNGRIIAAQEAGLKNIPVTTNEKLYREILTAREAEFAPGTIGNIYETVPESAMRPKGEATLADIQISTKPIKPKQPVSNKALEVKSQFLNRFDPIERFVRNVELERGTKLKPSENPMYYVKQFMGGGGIANYRIDNELTPILKQTKNFDGLRQYLVARRMNELASRGIGKKANTAIAELTQKFGPDEIANFDRISTQLYAYQRNQLDQLLATGVISKQSYDNIIAKNQFYIPFNRVIPDVIADTTQSGQKISGAKKLASLKAIKGSEKDIIDPIESVIKNTYDVQATVAKQKVLNSLVALSPDEFKPLPKGAGLKAPAIELFSDGKRVKLAADPELSRALNAMDEEQLNLVVRALSLPARALRAGATSLNVAFALPNVLRDQLSAAVNNKYGGIPMYDFVSGLASVMKKDDSYKKWILSGADQATLFAQDRTTLQRGVKDITGGIGYKAGKLVKSPLELFRIFGDLSEKGSRVGVFKRALKGATKEGLNTEDALLTAMRESREATIDFAQRGSKMKSFNAMVPFLNARVQGTYKLAQSFKNRPIQTMARGAAIASVPAAILYIHNNAEGNADIYKEIPDYIKRENFVIVTGDEKTPFIKIPKGEVGKIFANPVESFLAQIKRDSTNWGDTAKDIVDSFLPVGSVSEPARFITDIGPTAVTVPYQMLSNYDVFRGRNIVGQYQKDLPAAQQFSKYNTETAKKIGELLNISPAQLEFALSGFTGGLGRQGLQVADIAQGQRPPVQELPVLSRFLGEEKDLSATAQKVYEQAEKAKREKARENFRIKQALEKGDTSVLQGVDKTTATRLKRSVAEDQAKKDMSPIQKALFDLPADQLENIKQSGQYKDDIAVVEGIKDSIAEGLKAPKQAKTPKVKVSKARRGRRATGRRRTGRGRVAKVKVPRIKTPRVTVRGLPKVPTVKAKKVSFKVPKPKAGPRKTVKIKQG